MSKERFFSISITAISALLTAASFGYPAESSYFPRFLCVLMLLFSAINLVKSAKATPVGADGISFGFFAETSKTAIAVFGLTVAYVAGITKIGYFVSTVLFLFVAMFAFGQRRVLPAIIAAAIFVTVVYALFISFLGLSLPSGLLF